MLKVAYRKNGDGWEGVLKDGINVVWTCGHYHRNRDHGSKFSGSSACECARKELLRRNPEYVAAMRRASW